MGVKDGQGAPRDLERDEEVGCLGSTPVTRGDRGHRWTCDSDGNTDKIVTAGHIVLYAAVSSSSLGGFIGMEYRMRGTKSKLEQ